VYLDSAQDFAQYPRRISYESFPGLIDPKGDDDLLLSNIPEHSGISCSLMLYPKIIAFV
jgi:hypothetical protein